MTVKRARQSTTNLMYGAALFIIGTALYYSKLDTDDYRTVNSKKPQIQPVKYAGLICLISASLFIFIGLLAYVCESSPRYDMQIRPSAYIVNDEESVAHEVNDKELIAYEKQVALPNEENMNEYNSNPKPPPKDIQSAPAEIKFQEVMPPPDDVKVDTEMNANIPVHSPSSSQPPK